jgi:quinoprotein glucose dehydrogenase
VDGRAIDGVVQLTKQGFVFVFDRVTGAPVWPIEERPAPASDVEGEHAWPTQPFPTRPAPISPQGMTLEEAFNLTPALEAAAKDELRKYRLGPIYTPPSIQGSLERPGVIGGANWGGSAFNAETGMLFVKTSHSPAIIRLVPGAQANTRPGETDAEFAGAQGNTSFTPPGAEGGRRLPLVRPPYGEVVAINLNTGDIAWHVPFGDMPSLRSHPALKDVALPPSLGSAGAPGVITTKSGLVIGGTSDDSAMHALDATTGQELWRLALSRPPSATPMTYRTKSGRQFIVTATGSGANAGLVALSLK